MVTGHRSRADFSAEKLPENRLRPIPMIAAAVLSLACVMFILDFG